MSAYSSSSPDEGVSTAVKHSLGWLVVGNSVGLYLSLLLLKPEWQLGSLTYGRWVPVHLNVQLYGWTALPLVAWLFSIYEVDRSKIAAWAPAAVWGWTAALAIGVMHWLDADTSGKIFLDWKSGALWAFIMAQVLLLLVLAASWRDRSSEWSGVKRNILLGGLTGLALVPVLILFAASPKVYPPVDHLTGGPTGSSLLGSSLVVVGLMLMLPRVFTIKKKVGREWRIWGYFIFCWVFFGVAESIGGTHFDWWQNVSLLLMPPWVWLLASDWSRFSWPEGTRVWRSAMFGWWGLLVLTAYLMYFPWILDRIKFTQGLVAHSHLAMAGFTSSFCALLVVLLTRRWIGGPVTIVIWHLSVVLMIILLARMGWQEGAEPSWMLMNPKWREVGLALRCVCGLAMLSVSSVWLTQWKTK